MAGPSPHPDKARTLKRIANGRETQSGAARRLGLSRYTVHGWCKTAGLGARGVDPIRNDQERRATLLKALADELASDPAFRSAAVALIVPYFQRSKRQPKAEHRRLLNLLVGDYDRREARARGKPTGRGP
jgi:transposase-like protein